MRLHSSGGGVWLFCFAGLPFEERFTTTCLSFSFPCLHISQRVSVKGLDMRMSSGEEHSKTDTYIGLIWQTVQLQIKQ